MYLQLTREKSVRAQYRLSMHVAFDNFYGHLEVFRAAGQSAIILNDRFDFIRFRVV